MSEIDRPSYPRLGFGATSVGPPTAEYPRAVAGTDPSGGWEPPPGLPPSGSGPAPTPRPPKRHSLRLGIILLVTVVPERGRGGPCRVAGRFHRATVSSLTTVVATYSHAAGDLLRCIERGAGPLGPGSRC